MKMKLFLSAAAFLASLSVSSAYTPGVNTRRQAFATISGLVVTPSISNALELCNPKANNCVRTVWTPPASTSKEDAISMLMDVINAYPQEGQADVDGGGWKIADDNLASDGTARIEYSSSGKGKFAKFFNGGKPFVDDLKIEVDGDLKVQVKSQSRVGDSDFGVNGKRVSYLAAGLKAKGWSV